MENFKKAIITQARLGSSRLPGKILKPIMGKPMLEYHIRRLKESGLPVIIATTVNPSDEVVVEFGKEIEVDVFRGDEEDVLKRFYDAAVHYDLDYLVRVSSDCPLIDGKLIGQYAKQYEESFSRNIYASNCERPTFPLGMNFEIFSFELLKTAFEEATLKKDREHVTPFIRNNRSGNVVQYHAVQEVDYSGYRLTVDTQEDFELISILIEKYHADELSHMEIVRILEKYPDLLDINSHIQQKKV